MSSPIMLPPAVATRSAPDLGSFVEALLIAPIAQNLDAAPPLSMHHVGIHVMTSRTALSNLVTK
jgi:hypothetical protein